MFRDIKEGQVYKILNDLAERMRHIESLERVGGGIALHAPTHLQAATDPLSVGVPADIALANAAGAATNYVRRDHAHNHPYLAFYGHPGLLKSRTVITVTGASVYTVPAGINAILIQALAGGGGGGGVEGVAASCAAAGGGGGGSYAELLIIGLAATYNVNVGALGAGGAAGANDGATGGNTTIAGITCNGGSGGQGDTGTAAIHRRVGGAGGAVSTGGDVNTGGDTAMGGIVLSASLGLSGGGGSSHLGGGAQCKQFVGAGNAAANYGAGGSGAYSVGATNYAGGNGSQGIIIIWEFS